MDQKSNEKAVKTQTTSKMESEQRLEKVLQKLIGRLEYNEQKKPLDKREKKSIVREFLSQEDF